MVVKYHPNAPVEEGTTSPKIFIGRLIHSKSLSNLEIIPKAAIGVQTNGTIAFLDPKPSTTEQLQTRYAADGFANAQIVNLKKSQFLFPGLIDTHLHAPQWPNLALGMEGTLREWCENWTDPMEASYSDTAKARRVYADVTKTTLSLGSTTVAYNSSIHADATNILADCALAAGQRAIVGKMCITVGSTQGNWEESAEVSLADSEKSVKYIRSIDPEGRLVHPCVQPRGGPYCPPELMRGLGEQCKEYGAYVQAHMCETQSDIAVADRTLELHPKYSCYSDMYLSSGLLNSRSILAHCIHLQPKDIDNMAASRAGVAHNPNSNTCLRDGECRVRDLLDRGVRVGLGTDCSAGYMPSIHDAMRSASNVSRHLALKAGEDRYVLGFSEIVCLATMGGAQVVGMEDRIGNFEKGKKFDALLIDVEGVISADASLWDDGDGDGEAMVKKWVFLGDRTSIKKVYVDGTLVAGQDASL
ncbi:hypothetical protein B0A55_10412 [Friedmanniomyces simplex]|uniref:Amidohydrolase-related domain-containing protein n=1 Tax=Friedmanniomyces simplex TaxID=329884 RepID=A0A4U0WUU8_9PEZI|nr:hypothetical protein B0A55_10412 [Friedmanniomyces simplex]